MNMVQAEKKRDLSNMYSLLKSVPNALSVFIDTVLEHIKLQGFAVRLRPTTRAISYLIDDL